MLLKFDKLFIRPESPAELSLTSLDADILRHVRRHRFLRASHVMRLLPAPHARVLYRLSVLFRHGYLNRPKAQWRYDRSLLSRDVVYSLGKRGVRHLQSLGEVDSHRIQEKRVGQIYLEHTLEVADFMTRLESELPPGVNIEYLDDLSSNERPNPAFPWSVPIHYKGELLSIGVVPDRIFKLATKDEELLFCLEVDRGTMPVVRSNPAQSSYYRKLLAYHETWRTGLHLRQFGWRRFRVLTLTSSRERRNHIIEVCREVVAAGGSGLFMFADQENIEQASDLLRMPWITGDGEHLAKLLSETRC